MDNNLEEFSTDLRQQIVSSARQSGESFLAEEFAMIASEYLTDAGEIDDLNMVFYDHRGMRLDAYSVSEDEEVLDLFVIDYSGHVPAATVPPAQIKKVFDRLLSFRKAAGERLHEKLEPASPAYDVAFRLWELKESVTQVRLFYITDSVTKTIKLAPPKDDAASVSYHIWDVVRLHRLAMSGTKRETIEIDFQEMYGGGIPTLASANKEPYQSYLAIIPAAVLVDIYEQYGPRLLERNVRSFLQARGAVNSGIRKTILTEPQMFFAYNNGISATAEAAKIVQTPRGPALTWVRDLQIVNGAQTTASLFQAWKKDKADVGDISVQMKLSVISEAELVDTIVPRISQYSNSQNKIQAADFDANDPYHRALEELSRTIWAPSVSGTLRQTHWFYERARGQYLDERSRRLTPGRIKEFEETNPRAQKFTKLDVAKFENTWDQLPFLVSRGGQKNFREFTIRLKERGNFIPEHEYYCHLIAKAILFKTTEGIVQKLQLGGYRANVVTYSLALLSHATAQRVDLTQIWKDQRVPDPLQDLIREVAGKIFEKIVTDAGSSNVTEWCKKEKAWNAISLMTIGTSSIESILLKETKHIKPVGKIHGGIESLTDEEKNRLNYVRALSSEGWLALSGWASETNNLQNWQRSIAYSMGILLRALRTPSRKQAAQAEIILNEAKRLGFTHQSLVEEPSAST